MTCDAGNGRGISHHRCRHRGHRHGTGAGAQARRGGGGGGGHGGGAGARGTGTGHGAGRGHGAQARGRGGAAASVGQASETGGGPASAREAGPPLSHADNSVRRERWVDLANPGQHAASNVDRVLEARVLQHGQDLGATRPALAVQDDLLVLRELLQGGTGEEFALGDQRSARDGDDLVLVRLADVDEEDVVAPSSIAFRSLAVIVDPMAASAASSETAPQNAS